MSDLLKWACSFLPGSEVTVRNIVSSELYCGETTLLCSIELTDPKASFTSYHKDEIKVLSEGGSDFNMPCEIEVQKRSDRILDVYCIPEQSARAVVQLDLGKWYTFKGKSRLDVVFLPSCPAKLNITKVCGNNYVDGEMEVKLTCLDRFGNKATACEHEITVTSDPPTAVSLQHSKMKNGEYTLNLGCHVKCEARVEIELALPGERNNRRCSEINSVNYILQHFSFEIRHPPISWKCSTASIVSQSNNRVISGLPFTVEININDVFGKPAHPNLIQSISAITSQNVVLKSRLISQNTHSYLLEISHTKAGRHSVYIQLNGKIIQSNSNLDIHVLAASPKTLGCLKATCRSTAFEFKPKENAFYYGAWSSVQASIFDEFGNRANQVTDNDHYEVFVEAFNNKGTPVTLRWENAQISNGELCVDVLPKEVGQLQLIVWLKDKKNLEKESVSLTTHINVVDPPCSPSLSKIEFNDEDHNHCCIAGSEYKFQLHINDVFGNSVRQTSTAQCNIVTKINPEFPSHSSKRNQGYIKRERDSASEDLRFTVTVGLETAGLRQLKVTVQNSKYVDEKKVSVQVLPSKPHSLTQLQYITKSSKDPNFTADPKLLYNNQWSTLEAVILDEYNNVVTQMDGDCKVRLEARGDQEKPIKVSCNDAVIEDGLLRLQVKGEGVGRQDFLAILQSSNCNDRPNHEYQLQTVQLEVVDPPFSLNLSEIEKPDSCVAGTEPKMRLIPFDVFGNPFLANSTARCNLSGKFLDSQSQSTHKKERISCGKAVNAYNYFVEVSVLLTRAGERNFEILDNESGAAKLKFSLEVKPDESNVHWDVMITENTYKNERLTLTAQLLDQFGNKVVVHPSYQSQLLQESGPEDGLICTKTSISENTVSIEYHFTKKGTYVLSLQLHGHTTEKSINVQHPPVDPDRSTVRWVPKYDDQPLFPDDETFLCRVYLKDVHGNNYEGDVSTSNLICNCGQTQVQIVDIQPVDSVSQFDVTVSLKGVLDIENVDLEPEFWFSLNGRKITRSPLQLSFDGFQEYDDDDLFTVNELQGEIYCRNVMKSEINGPDFTYLNNIKRVCELDEDPEIEDYEDEEEEEEDKYVKIQLPDYEFKKTRKFSETLLHLLKAHYYRNQAFEADKERNYWKEKATESFDETKRDKNADRSRPNFCSSIKEKYATLMNEYHNKACEEVFQFFNIGRSQSEIDLHGLLVVDEKKLRNYERQLQDKNEMSNKNVKAKIQKEREKGDEAIRKLRERLDTYDIEKAREEEEPWLEIIVGSGHHSKIKDRQNIRPKVEKYLKEKHVKFSAVNKGALVITYEEYRGREPCFGEYYCRKCNHRWRNGRSWVGKWQGCYDCYEKNGIVEECLPLKQRKHRKWLPYKPTGAHWRGEIPHLKELCQKCKELGENCPTARLTGY